MSKLAVIGGSYLQLPVVKRAKELGHEVHCFAWEEGAVCKDVADFFYPISIIEKEIILEKCRETGINGILTIASDTAVVTVNYVAEKLGLVSNPNQYTHITTNKFQMSKAFENYSIPSPKFIVVSQNEEIHKINLSFPLIVKPTDRSGSLGVEKVYDIPTLFNAVKRAKEASFSHSAIIEEYIEGVEISVESISFAGQHYILQITDKVTTEEPYFVELEHHQPSSISIEIQKHVVQIVLKALDALHIKYGASHAELKITPEGDIKVIEIGARMGGDFIGSDLVKLSTGYDFLEGVINVALGKFDPPKLSNKKYSGVYFLSKETDYLLSIMSSPQSYHEIVESKITDSELRNIRCSSDRSGYLIYQSDKKLDLKVKNAI